MKLKDASRLKLVKTYLKVWLRLTKLRLVRQIINTKFGGILFLLGKIIRLLFQVVFIYILVGKTNAIVGYNLYQALFILLTLNVSGTLIQMLLRGVYLFRQRIIDGSFDYFLLSPLNELFLSLFSYTDPLDIVMMIPSTIALIWVWAKAGIPITFLTVSIYITFIIIAIIFAIAWHTIVIASGVIFLEVDNIIMVYRDVETMARFPIDIYNKTLQFGLTYIIPIAVMATIPAKVLFGKSTLTSLPIFAVLSILNLYLAWKYWNFALTKYSSASS